MPKYGRTGWKSCDTTGLASRDGTPALACASHESQPPNAYTSLFGGHESNMTARTRASRHAGSSCASTIIAVQTDPLTVWITVGASAARIRAAIAAARRRDARRDHLRDAAQHRLDVEAVLAVQARASRSAAR